MLKLRNTLGLHLLKARFYTVKTLLRRRAAVVDPTLRTDVMSKGDVDLGSRVWTPGPWDAEGLAREDQLQFKLPSLHSGTHRTP